MFTVIKPEDNKPLPKNQNNTMTFFLGGSIENGKAENWQDRITNKIYELYCLNFSKSKNKNVLIFNPRNDNWNSDLNQDRTNLEFKHQVIWELEKQEMSNYLIYYFCGGTKSPITLLELGLFAKETNKKILVFCPKEFWRFGNVDLVCERYGIDLFTNENDFFKRLKLLFELFS